MIKFIFKWHQLEKGGFMTCQVGDEKTFDVLSTPVSEDPRKKHEEILTKKVEQWNQKQSSI